jgi:PAS domain S-box-containing protein
MAQGLQGIEMEDQTPDPTGPAGFSDSPALADALENDRFRKFLDHVPFAVAVSDLHPSEHITYANPEFERLIGRAATEIEGKTWTALPVGVTDKDPSKLLTDAIVQDEDYLGTFCIEHNVQKLVVDAWSNLIHSEDGKPIFRLVSLSDIGNRPDSELPRYRQPEEVAKDTLLKELQHRVKNNLQMITSLIRMEARNIQDKATEDRFTRLAGRVEALAILYRSLSGEASGESVDLGVFLSQIASAVMVAHAVEGIQLDLKVDTWPVAINVAMPTGLVVNEVLTNSLKHGFVGREGGKITLHSLVDANGCVITISDNGVGLKAGDQWPPRGRLAGLIIESLRENAGANVKVDSNPGEGVRVTITFSRANAAAA